MNVPAQGTSVNVPIRRTAHCVHVIPANDTEKRLAWSDIKLFGPRLPRGTNLGGYSSTRGQCAKSTELPRIANSPTVTTPSLTLRYCLQEVSLRPEVTPVRGSLIGAPWSSLTRPSCPELLECCVQLHGRVFKS